MRETRHTPSSEPARHNHLELTKVGVDVERDAMHRNPARKPHSHRTNLSRLGRADPDTRRSRIAHAGHGEVFKCRNNRPLEHAQVAMHAKSESVQVENQIHDELPWTMPRHIAAAVSLNALNAARLELLSRKQHMFVRLSTARNCDNCGRVFEQIDHTRPLLW